MQSRFHKKEKEKSLWATTDKLQQISQNLASWIVKETHY